MQNMFYRERLREKWSQVFIAAGWTCIVALLYFSFPAESRAQNLLTNGGFELGESRGLPDAWLSESYRPGAVIARTSEKAYLGEYALRIDSPAPNDARAIQTVSVKPNTFYRLSGYCWTEGVAPGDEIGANLCIMLPDYYYSEPAWTGNADTWRKTELVFKTAAGQSDITVGVRLGMWNNTVRGTAFFDNISLEELASPPAVFKQLKTTHDSIKLQKSAPRENPEKHLKYWLWAVPLAVLVVFYIVYLDLKKD